MVVLHVGGGDDRVGEDLILFIFLKFAADCCAGHDSLKVREVRVRRRRNSRIDDSVNPECAAFS